MNELTESGAKQGLLQNYATGFFLSIVLTVIAFTTVIYEHWPQPITLAIIFTAAMVQILAHLHYFLHLDTSSRARWNVLALLFAVLIMVLIIGGTVWIMYHLHNRLS